MSARLKHQVPSTEDVIESTPPADEKRRGETRGFLIVVGLCLAVIAGLALVARGGESAGGPGPVRIPTPAITTGEACGNWARYWMDESGVGASVASLEGLSNCRQAADGTWYIPTGSNDPRLPDAPILTTAERAETEPLRATLTTQIRALRAEFPTGLERWLDNIYSVSQRPIMGHMRDGISYGITRDRYTRLTQAFLMNPDYGELARYVGWWVQRREAAFAEFHAACFVDDLTYLHHACDGVGNTVGVGFPPWPWDLTDPLTMDTYLASTLVRDETPTGDEATPAARP
jgi:hypothetical protein